MQDRRRASAAKGGQLPGATGGGHAHGLVIAIPVVMALALPRIRLRLSVPLQAAGPDPWPGGYGRGSGDTMNAFTANDLKAADLLARSGTMTARRRLHYWPAMARAVTRYGWQAPGR